MLGKIEYVIKYTAYTKSGFEFKSGVMRVKNKDSEFAAKASFEDYLIKKYPEFHRLVIHECDADVFAMFGRESPFKDFFKGKK